MTPLYPGADASQPGSPLPPGTRILCGYIGALDLPGPPDTPHVWTRAEWNAYLDPASPLHVPGLRLLPIYTHDYPGNPQIDGQNAIDAAVDLGWSDKLGRIIAWDSEQLSDEPYARGLDDYLWAHGFRLMIYEHSPAQNVITPHGGIWQVTLTPSRPRWLPRGTVGQQWAFGAEWDLDVFSGFVWENAGRSLRRQEP